MSVQEAALLLGVSTKTIYRWVGEGRIPSYRVAKQHRFDRTELMEWATSQRMAYQPAVAPGPSHQGESFQPLDQALAEGGIHYRVEGGTRQEVLRSALAVTFPADPAERERLYLALEARETLASTSIGDGIALPHPRNPIQFELRRPIASLCFLEREVDWRAPDRRPVSVLIIVAGGTVRGVLQLHSHTLFALRDPALSRVLAERGSREEILAEARRVARDLASPDAEYAAP
ncbi:MAG: helix-turn-helix domain-containing protein [Deltaproteobacteria bacterium]|nr:helix-turn-helix domain-containing protein [Deltaproteobacteria bacterium]